MWRALSLIAPSLAFSWPGLCFMYLVLPATFVRTIEVSFFGWMVRVTALTATWPPKRMVRSRVASRLISSSTTVGPSALVLDRHVHLGRLDFLHQMQVRHRTRTRAGRHAEVVHRLHRLVVLLAERHQAL